MINCSTKRNRWSTWWRQSLPFSTKGRLNHSHHSRHSCCHSHQQRDRWRVPLPHKRPLSGHSPLSLSSQHLHSCHHHINQKIFELIFSTPVKSFSLEWGPECWPKYRQKVIYFVRVCYGPKYWHWIGLDAGGAIARQWKGKIARQSRS